MIEFPETLGLGQIISRELTKEIERRYNTYVELERQLAAKDAALKEIQAVAESSVKTHGYDKAHVRVADIAKRAVTPTEWKTNDELRKQLAELLDWQQKAFAAHPNIDIDIDRMNGGN